MITQVFKSNYEERVKINEVLEYGYPSNIT